MSDYTKLTNFATKDGLASGDPAKIIKGKEIDDEFNSIQTAISTKQDTLSLLTVTDGGASVSVSGNLKVTGDLTTGNTTALKLPADTSANRPVSPTTGMVRYNSTLSRYEGWNGTKWVRVQNQDAGSRGALTVYSPDVSLTGTYNQVGTTTITVTATSHGLAVNDIILLTFGTGTAVTGKYTVVTVPTADTFTVTAAATASTSGSVTVSSYWEIPNKSIAGDKLADGFLVASNFPTQSGDAPVYGVRAWVQFDGTVADNIGGTYTRDTGFVVTVTTTVNHNHTVGHSVYLDFSSGATDGLFVVTEVVSPTVFKVNHTSSGTASGTVTLNRRKVNASGNVANVITANTGEYVINFTKPMPDQYYAFSGACTDTNNWVTENLTNARTKEYLRIAVRSDGGGFQNPINCSMMFIR